MLKTKSIRSEPNSEDGKRICVMRSYNVKKHPEYFPVDEHDIDLSPSLDLLRTYHKGLPWDKYVERFRKETLGPQSEKIKKLAREALDKDITLLCYEDSPDFCHRRLLALDCLMYEPRLELKIE